MSTIARLHLRNLRTQYPHSAEQPSFAHLLGLRQFVGFDGQQWITLEQLAETHSNVFLAEEPGVHSFFTEPGFGIGERAFLIRTPTATFCGIVLR